MLTLSFKLLFELFYSLARQVLSFATICLNKLNVVITRALSIDKAVIKALQARVILNEATCWVPGFMVSKLPIAESDLRTIARSHRHWLF